MFTIKNKNENIEIIKNSKFISLIYNINNKDDIEKHLKEVKKQYPKATHYCYAYILDEDKKSSDDKEPSGTAGYPILHVLEENNLNHVLCIVIRYFGGIKLGAGGLVRAYTKAASNNVKSSKLKELKTGNLIEINFPYEISKDIDYILKDSIILEKIYNDKIKYKVIVNNEKLKILKEKNIEMKILSTKIYY